MRAEQIANGRNLKAIHLSRYHLEGVRNEIVYHHHVNAACIITNHIRSTRDI